MHKLTLTPVLLFWIITLFIPACAAIYPAQEMSNARQTLQAAREAKADVYAAERYQEAQRLLEQATVKLEEGEYQQARELALAAKQYANKARLEALSHQQK